MKRASECARGQTSPRATPEKILVDKRSALPRRGNRVREMESTPEKGETLPSIYWLGTVVLRVWEMTRDAKILAQDCMRSLLDNQRTIILSLRWRYELSTH
jgi:hypothetical protein